MEAEPDEEQKVSRGVRLARLLLRGLGWAVVVLAIVGTALGVLGEFACRQRLAGRRKAWPAESAAATAAQAAPRPVLLGQATQGNAAHDYLAIEWIVDPRSKWPQTVPPGVAPPLLARGFAHTLKTDLLWRATKDIERGRPVPAETAAVVSALAPVSRHLTDGLSRPVCDWEASLGPAGYELPDLLSFRLAALVHLALAAGDPDALARAGLQVVCFGQDVGRIPTLIGRMVGIGVEGLGIKALEAALASGVSPGTLRDVVRVLAALRPPSFEDCLVTEGLQSEVQITILEPALLAEVNRTAFVGFHARGTAIARAPNTDRASVDPNLAADMAASPFLLAGRSPDMRQAANHVDDSELSRGAVRLLAAAHLFRLERGSWPPDLAALAPFAGGPLPADPYQGPGATLSLVVEGPELRVYSWGADGFDDAGATGPKRWEAPDYTFTTR